MTNSRALRVLFAGAAMGVLAMNPAQAQEVQETEPVVIAGVTEDAVTNVITCDPTVFRDALAAGDQDAIGVERKKIQECISAKNQAAINASNEAINASNEAINASKQRMLDTAKKLVAGVTGDAVADVVTCDPSKMDPISMIDCLAAEDEAKNGNVDERIAASKASIAATTAAIISDAVEETGIREAD